MISKLVLLSIFTGATIFASTFDVTVSQSSYQPGATVVVDVSATNITDLYAFQFDLSFNPAVLSAKSVTEEGYFASNGVSFGPVSIDNTSGTVSNVADTLSGAGPGFTGTTLLATIDFTALSAGSTSITPVNVQLLDSGLNAISATVNSATVNVSSTPEPASAAMLGSAVVAGFLFRRASRSRKRASIR